MSPADLVELVAAGACVGAGAAVQGLVGFGAGLLAVPIVALFAPWLVPGPMLLAVSVITLMGAGRERAEIDWPIVGWATLGRVPGTVLGSLLLAAVSGQTLGLIVAVSVLVGVGLSLVAPRIEVRPATVAVAGVASGIGAAAASIGGPPMALVLQHGEGPRVRATLSAMFVVLAPVSLTGIALAGHLDAGQLAAGLWLMAPAAFGFRLSSPLRHRIDATGLRPLVLGLSAAAGMVLLLRSW